MSTYRTKLNLMVLAIFAMAMIANFARGAQPAGTAATSTPVHQHHTAGGVDVELWVDPPAISAAQSVRVLLRVSSPSTVRITMPRVTPPADGAPTKIGDFTLQSLVDDPAIASGTPESPVSTFTRRMTLDPFLPGTYTIPSFDVAWRGLDGTSSGVIKTTPVRVDVVSLLPAGTESAKPSSLDAGQIRDAIEPPGIRGGTGAIIAIATAVATSLAAGAWWTLRRNSENTDPTAAHEELLAAWPHDGADRGEMRLCDALAAAGRTVLADRFDKHAAACSGAQMRELANAPHATPPVVRLIGQIERADEVRFSGSGMSADDRRKFLSDVIESVRAVRRMPRRTAGGAP